MERTELEVEIDLLEDILVDLNSKNIMLLAKGDTKVAGGLSVAWLSVHDMYLEKMKAFREQ